MGPQLCEYKVCMKEATVKGFVMVKDGKGGHTPEPVWACDKHKKLSGFFETLEEGK